MRLQRYLVVPWLFLSIGTTLVLSLGLLALTVVGSFRWTAGAPVSEVATWVALQWPAVVARVLPASVLLVTAIVLGGQVASRVLLAMAAGGIAPWRVLWPWIPVLAVIGLASLASSEWVVPAAERRATVLWWSITEGRAPTFRLVRRDLRLPEGMTMRFEAYDAASDVLQGVRVVRMDGDVLEVWLGQRAVWFADGLHLHDVRQARLDLAALDEPGLSATERLEALAGGSARHVSLALTLPEVRSETEARYSGGTVGDGRGWSRHVFVARDPGSSASERMEAALRAHETLVSAAGVVVVALVAMLGIVHRSIGMPLAMAWASGLGIAWLLVGALGHNLARGGMVPVALAAWLPAIVVAALGVAAVATPRGMRAPRQGGGRA